MTVVAAGIMAAATIGVGMMQNSQAKKQANSKSSKARRLEGKMNSLEANRQKIINPFEGVQDLSNMLSNPFASLSVATQAAEMKIEEADISLANTLDTIRTTGGAGSATALAQAALQSKKGVAASIEQQEVANEKARVQGEQALISQKMAEKQRIQQAEVSGKQFVFGQQETRDMQQLDRLSNQIGALRGQAAASRAAGSAALTGAMASGIGMIGAGVAAKKGE